MIFQVKAEDRRQIVAKRRSRQMHSICGGRAEGGIGEKILFLEGHDSRRGI